jgi:glutaredoxin
MNKLHLEYVEFKLGKDFTREELRELVPENLPLTVPQIFVYNKRIGGYEDFAEYCENTGIMGLQG